MMARFYRNRRSSSGGRDELDVSIIVAVEHLVSSYKIDDSWNNAPHRYRGKIPLFLKLR